MSVLQQDVPARGQPVNIQQRAEMRDILVKALDWARRGQLPIKIPATKGLMQKHPDRHFHFKPEVFIQIRGRTIFDLPDERILVKAGDLCIIPAGLPHKETIEDDEKGPFRNLVIGYYSRTLSMHFAHEVLPGKPDIQAIEFFDTPNLDVFLTLTSHLVTTHHALAPARQHILNGLMTALLGMLQNLVETGSGTLNKDVAKVFHTKWLVREQFSNPQLNVKSIAAQLNCSPDYLSHLFHSETGEKLIHYIQRIRIDGAKMALESTQLYISEIAFSSGFRDPAYFTRVFRKLTGESPHEYRGNRDQDRLKSEEVPKTIYFDRDDYSHGQPRSK